jgi:hypothetical protein
MLEGSNLTQEKPTRDAKVEIDQVLASVQLDTLPKEWIYDPQNPDAARLAMFKHYEQLEKAYENAGVKTHFRLAKHPRAGPHFLSVRYPEPIEEDNEFADKKYIYMRHKDDKSGDYELVPLAQMKEREDEGWLAWVCPPSPTGPDREDKDPRPCPRPVDSFTEDAPCKDIEGIYGAQIKGLLAAEPKPNWTPGRSLYDGEFDEFDEWQCHGRRILPEMAKNTEKARTFNPLDFKLVTPKAEGAVERRVTLDEKDIERLGLPTLQVPKPLSQIFEEKKDKKNTDADKDRNNSKLLPGGDRMVWIDPNVPQ